MNNRSLKPNFLLLAVATLLMLSASFMDNARGVILPEVMRLLAISVGESSWFLALGNVAALSFALGLGGAIRRISETRVTLLVSSLAVLIVGFAVFVTDYPRLLVFAFVLGGVIAAMGTLSNILTMSATPTSLVPRTLSAMHVMYGVGSFLAPVFAAPFIAKGLPWQLVLLGPLPLVLGIFVLLFINQRRQRDSVQNSAKPVFDSREVSRSHKKSSFTSETSLKVILLVAFGFYVCAEVLTSMWMTTYLVKVRGVAVDDAAPILAGFFVCMAFSRVACSLWARESMLRPLIYSALLVPALGFLIGLAGVPWAFSFVGLAGPWFPLFMSRIAVAFPESRQSVTVYAVAVMQLFLAIAHLVLGKLADRIGMESAFAIPLVFFGATLVCVYLYFRREDRYLAMK